MERTENDRRSAALSWLATVRQVEPDPETATAYQLGLEDLPAWAVEQACKRIGYSKRAEYEKAWPELGDIRAIAEAAVRHRAEMEASRRLLAPPATPRADRERLAKFMADVKALIAKKGMK